MKNIGLAIFVILLLVGCENNKSFKSTLNEAQISQNDIEYFQKLVGDTVLFTVDQSGSVSYTHLTLPTKRIV